ncbi:MAG: hypothetical protein IJ343_15975 [Clostridia bacterium]|nr:hypothetical protein [Clostridia bacterium]
MLYAVLIALILLMLWPLLAEVRMVIRSILSSCLGGKSVQTLLKEQPALRRLTLTGLSAHLPRLHREYGQYTRLQLLLVIAAAVCIALVVLFIRLRWVVPALIVTFGFDIAAFAGISVIHAHAGYDPDAHTTRYDRHGK